MAIIAEEYGELDQSLLNIVEDIADCVVARSRDGKNYGTILIPDGLLFHLHFMKNLLDELSKLLHAAKEENKLKEIQSELLSIDTLDEEKSSIFHKMTPWSIASFKSFPHFIRKELIQFDMEEVI